MDNFTYGAYIRQRRKELHVSQQSLADALQCTPQAISKYENDKASLYLACVGPLCRILKVDVRSFLLRQQRKDNDDADRYDFDTKAFAQVLLSLRRNKGWTQKELSERSDIPTFKITKWENGKGLPTLEEFIKIADFYNIPYEKLYFAHVEEEKPAEPPKEEPKKRRLLPFLILAGVVFLVILVFAITLPLTLIPRFSSSSPSTSFPASSASFPSSSSSFSSSAPSSSSSGQPPFIVSVDITQ